MAWNLRQENTAVADAISAPRGRAGSGIFFLIAVVALLAAAPVLFSFDNYLLHICITIAFNIMLAVSMWLIWTLGLVSFAHAGFMGIGAYTAALLHLNLGMPLWVTMFAAALVSGVIAAILAVPLMRTTAVYFFMASWAVGEVIKRIFAHFRDVFGGWDGLFNIRPPVVHLGEFSLNFSSRFNYYYLALAACILVILFVHRIHSCRIGKTYWSIYDNELLAKHVGINTTATKIAAFSIACAIAGLTGALYAHYHTYINPKSFDIWQSEFVLIYMIVGGLNTIVGPIAGATVLTVLDELLRPTEYYRVIIFGVIVIVSVLLFPGGLESLFQRIRKALPSLRRKNGENR